MQELNDMIKKHDITGDNALSFEEFKAIFYCKMDKTNFGD